jgi:hypothetical protein
LLELADIQAVIRAFDEPALLYRWQHPDAGVDALAAQALRIAAAHGSQSGGSRREIFGRLWSLVNDRPLPEDFFLAPQAAIPCMDEPWFCCAEPTEEQVAHV